MAIASLILGIISLVTSFFPGFVGFISAVLALVFGIIGRKEIGKEGFAIAGIVCSSIALALDIIFVVLMFIPFFLVL